MIQANEQAIRQVVQEVLAQLGRRTSGTGSNGRASGDWGVFRTVDDAVAAANDGFKKLRDGRWPTGPRRSPASIASATSRPAELGRLELEETKIGRLDHKIEKLQDRQTRAGHRVPQVRRHAAATTV